MKCESCFWNFNSNFDLSTSLDFSFQRLTEMSTKEIKVKYAEFITSLSVFKGTIDT